jgi:hypothetical protein
MGEPLDRVDDPRVKLAATFLQEAPVRDLVSERVREGVLEIRIEPGLVEELGGLQVVESATERLVRQAGDRLEQYTRRDLPTPASPTIAATCPWPLPASCCARRVRAGPAPVTS